MSKHSFSKPLSFFLLVTAFGGLPALPVTAQIPLGDITVDDFEKIDDFPPLTTSQNFDLPAESVADADFEAIADFPPLITSQSFQLPVESSTPNYPNLAEQIPDRQIFIPPVQSRPITSPTSQFNQPTPQPQQTEMPSRPSLSDVMRVQPAPLPYFVYQRE